MRTWRLQLELQLAVAAFEGRGICSAAQHNRRTWKGGSGSQRNAFLEPKKCIIFLLSLAA